MRAKIKLLILLSVSIITMVGFGIWRTTSKKTDQDTTGSISTGVEAMSRAMSSPADTVPDAENVSSQYHAEVEGLEKRLKSVPNDTTHLIRLAQLYLNGHQARKAIQPYVHYLKLHPQNHQAWLDLATCYGKQKDWQNALKATEGLLKSYPNDAFGRYNLGAIHANMGQFQAAREIWTQLTGLKNNPHVVAMVKKSLEQLNKMSSAMKAEKTN